jgi:hypothetical protein
VSVEETVGIQYFAFGVRLSWQVRSGLCGIVHAGIFAAMYSEVRNVAVCCNLITPVGTI